MLIQLIVELVVGGLCGYAAMRIMKGNASSILLNVILGVIGGIVGGIIGNLLGIGGGWISGIVLTIAGACLVVWLYRKFFLK
ncbi:MAG: GlsB/YeaQ/YmgE family stress response membrane protein [Clostridiales bacterium]|nr:GlsB/YeaQ/YmgE family stress response membrane protein [Bacillota bacterium]MCR5006748.1 GlsB/YeaQ/YmgE family stress response membrane protein [Clostridiales bacterium]